MTAVLLESPPLDVYGQMALDEAILDTGTADFTLRFFRWAPGARPSVTFGYFQRINEVKAVAAPSPSLTSPSTGELRGTSPGGGGFFNKMGVDYPSPSLANARQVPLVRRPTGGGIVHHTDDLTFSFAFKSDGTLSPQAMYKNIHRGVHVGLKQFAKIQTALWSPPGWRDRPKCETQAACECFDQAEPMDLVAEDDSKVLGGALRRRAGRILYQGSLQLRGTLSPSPSPVNGRGETEIERAIVKGFEVEWGVPFVKKDAAAGLLKEAAVRRETYLSDAWNRKR